MKHLIIDTDVCNNIDDQFAIAYALTNESFNVLAITISPYCVENQRKTIFDGVIDSYFEAKRLCRLAGKKYVSIEKGSTGFISTGYNETNDAVQKIIKICMSRNKTYIVCLGTLTNLALAIKKEPKIIDKIEVVWLGTKHLLEDKFTDNNYTKDKLAFETVIKSDVKLTVIPSYVGKFNATSIYELYEHVAINSLGKHLVNNVENSSDLIKNRGLKYIYDLTPLVYLSNKKFFKSKDINKNLLLKEQTKIENPTKLTYVYDGASNNSVYLEFLKSLQKAPTNVFKSGTFFTSDTHFGQKNKSRIKEHRLKSSDQHDHEYIKKWNSIVGEKDTVYHLGDFGDYKFVQKLNGNIVLICGSYEVKDYGKDFIKFRAKLIKLGFKDVIQHNLVLENVLNVPVNLTHKPENTNPNMFNLYGHVHSLKIMMKNGLNVCTELHHFKPIGEDIVNDYINFLNTKADYNVFVE